MRCGGVVVGARALRAASACVLLPDHPVLAVAASESLSLLVPPPSAPHWFSAVVGVVALGVCGNAALSRTVLAAWCRAQRQWYKGELCVWLLCAATLLLHHQFGHSL